MRLRDRVAIVTGGSRGIGEAISRRFAKEGAKVAIAARNRADIECAVENIRSEGGEARGFPVDLRDMDACARLIPDVAGEFGSVDTLINNAGIFQPVPIEDMTEEIWDQQIDLNLKSAFFLSKAAIGQMRKQGGGKIVNISSIAGIGGFPNSAAYCASKGGLVNLTKAMCMEVSKHNINVNSVAPGNIKTDMNAHLREIEGYDDHNASLTPSGVGHLDPSELTGAVVFLASDDARSVHGINLLVDGGWVAW